jgi:hypothetical protein
VPAGLCSWAQILSFDIVDAIKIYHSIQELIAKLL